MAAGKRPEADEDYWASSRYKSKGINPFDDSIDIEETKKYLKQPGFFDDDDEEEDTINWDGSLPAAPRVEYTKSARYRPPEAASVSGSSASATTVSTTAGSRRPPPQMQKPATQGGRPTFSEEPASSNLSIDDVVSRATPIQAPTITDIAKLEAEINFLKRSLHAAKKDRYEQIPPAETIRRIILGQPYSLEPYRSREDKMALLDEAIRLHDGNTITMAVLFLRDTVKRTIFNMALFKRPCAVEHYISYLRTHFEFEMLSDILGMLGRTEEVAILKYKQAVAPANTDTRLRALQACYRAHFESEPSLVDEALMVQDHINLLERQRPIEFQDDAEDKKGAAKFRENPRVAKLVGLPVITTLYYCAFYHYGLDETKLASPAAIRKAYRLTDKQYMWSVLAALVKLRRWQELEAIFQTKGWLGSTKMKSVIGFDRVVDLLSRFNSPREVMNKYCKLIEDSSRRIEVGQKLGCHEAVVDTYRDARDRQQLNHYFNHLKPNSQEWFYARDVLGTTTTKWKN